LLYVSTLDSIIFLRYAQELNLVSMSHLQLMLRQMLTKEEVPNVMEWEDTLLKLALRIARELGFTAHPHRQGPDMDVRRYVKIKKIPGGAPKDSEYVDGAVITKNVAHKSMTRLQRHPRVMLVTFPLEFSRVEGQYMHFGQIVRQEKEYMGNLVSRIAAYRPHVVLAEKSVSRLALDALAKQGIAVARSVKPSAIQFVARITQADVFSSMDKLALEPRLGHCTRFRIQTFDHPLIPGQRKTYMRFEGCNHEMGCTIVLRGGDRDTLRRIKHVTRFLTFIVRSLKLETHLWKDSVIALPALTPDAVPPHYPFRPDGDVSPSHLGLPALPSGAAPMDHDSTETDLPGDDAEQLRLSRRIQQALDPYLTTFISVSATLRFSPPYPLSRMKELDDELIRVKQAWEDEVVRREERQPATPIQSTPTPKLSDHEDVKAQIESLSSPAFSATPPGETLSTEGEPGYFDYKSTFASSQVTLSAILPAYQTPTEESLVPLKTADHIALESRYSLVKWQHQEHQRIWEWYLRKNADDFVVEKYQCISLWEYTLPIEEYGRHAACFPPSLRYITYYGENDCTLGQFIESSTADTLSWSMSAKQPICTGKGCNQPLSRHCKVYVHNETKIFVAVEQWDGQIVGLGPTPELTTTWSACCICGSATPFIPVSEEMQRYSFAKFLELHFYPADVQLVQGAGCEHNIYRHHIRYFAKRGMTVRFQADPITLHEIVFPPMRIRVRPETQLRLKNADYERLVNRNSRWYAALMHDLNLIRMDAATGDEEIDARFTTELNQLILRAESEKAEVVRMVNRIYHESLPTDTLALNQVRSYLQDKIVAWQADFDKLPKPKGVFTEKSGRRASTFGTVRAIWPRRFDLPGMYDNAVPSSGVSEAEETAPPPSMRRMTAKSFISASSASEASETEGTLEKVKTNGTQESEKATEPATKPPSASEPALSAKSDPDSDSTISAPKGGVVATSVALEPSASVSTVIRIQLLRLTSPF
jgi:1-phosphatidylinositol-3-phosphate 5-kinase